MDALELCSTGVAWKVDDLRLLASHSPWVFDSLAETLNPSPNNVERVGRRPDPMIRGFTTTDERPQTPIDLTAMTVLSSLFRLM